MNYNKLVGNQFILKIIFLLGTIGSFLSAIALFPQTIQVYKTKDVDSFSISYLLLRMFGLSLVSLQAFYLGVYNIGFLTTWLVINYGYYLLVKISNKQNI